MNYLKARELARQLRKNQTKAEQVFWDKVRNRKFRGLKFQRQFLIKYRLLGSSDNYFVADFYCHQYKLIVEIDGSVHQDRGEYDFQRESIIKGNGYCVQRFTNQQVLQNWSHVERKLNIFLVGAR